eukprot:scaffold597_cov242-Prasinococcus_capsulatus_cf.AAC.5
MLPGENAGTGYVEPYVGPCRSCRYGRAHFDTRGGYDSHKLPLEDGDLVPDLERSGGAELETASEEANSIYSAFTSVEFENDHFKPRYPAARPRRRLLRPSWRSQRTGLGVEGILWVIHLGPPSAATVLGFSCGIPCHTST